jgi:hypothetical protein
MRSATRSPGLCKRFLQGRSDAESAKQVRLPELNFADLLRKG